MEKIIEAMKRSPSILNERNATMTGKSAPKMDVEGSRFSHRLFMNSLNPGPKCVSINITRTAGTKSYPSSKPIHSLKRTTISELKINIPGRGFYLLLRSIEEPYSVNGITTIVEDHTGDVFLFTAYNMVNPELETKPEHILPLGTIFILKEPFLKPGLSGDFLLRTDSPSDVIILHKYHPLYSLAKDVRWKNKISKVPASEPSTSEGWKEKGNQSFRSKDYTSALICYLSAVQVLQQEVIPLKIVLYLNLSMTYLNLEKFESAQDYAMRVLDLEPRNLKGLYRAGRANYELRQYEAAKRYFQRLLDDQPGHEEGTKELRRTLKRLSEATGKISVEELYRTAKSKPRTSIECADYVGPLKAVYSFDKRRSVEATEDIEPGTLIAVSKAIIHVFIHPGLDLPHYVNRDESVTLGEVGKAVQEACQLVYNNPEVFGKALYELPINDAFFDAIKPSLYCDEETKEEPLVDVERLRKILITNGIPINDKFRPMGLVTGQPSSCGLFLFPSYMNHSCLANASWTTYNDVMVVHATRHIKEGDEVTIARIHPMLPYSSKLSELNKREIQCDCYLCKCDRNVPPPIREKIENLITEFQQCLKTITGKTAPKEQTTKFAEQMNALVKLASSARLDWYVAYPYHFLALYYDKPKEAVDTLWKAICASGFDRETLDDWSEGRKSHVAPEHCIFSTVIISCIYSLAAAYENLGLRSESLKYYRALEVVYSVYQGATKQMVKEMCLSGSSLSFI